VQDKHKPQHTAAQRQRICYARRSSANIIHIRGVDAAPSCCRCRFARGQAREQMVAPQRQLTVRAARSYTHGNRVSEERRLHKRRATTSACRN
jgi:hypothetical protein